MAGAYTAVRDFMRNRKGIRIWFRMFAGMEKGQKCSVQDGIAVPSRERI